MHHSVLDVMTTPATLHVWQSFYFLAREKSSEFMSFMNFIVTSPSETLLSGVYNAWAPVSKAMQLLHTFQLCSCNCTFLSV